VEQVEQVIRENCPVTTDEVALELGICHGSASHIRHDVSEKFRAQPLVGKVMLTLFLESKGPILEHYMSMGTMITSPSYCDLLVNHLKPAV
jgi:hypothetical protein